MSLFRRLFDLLKEAGTRWSDDQCLRLGAAFSYYAVFSIFPLLLLCVTSVGFIVGHDASIRERILDYVSNSGAHELRPLMDQTLTSMKEHSTARGIGAVVGFVTLLFGASGVFSELESAFNVIWRVKAPPSRSFLQTVLATVKDKALSFLVVLGAGCALLLSLLVSAALSAVDSTASQVVKSPILWLLVETGVSIGMLTALLAAMYQMIPRTKVAWRDVLGGALLTAFLFTALKRLFAWYLGHIGSYAAYGAVGGVLGLLAWIYLASLLLFFGAEVTRVYAERFGSLADGAGSKALAKNRNTVDDGAGHPGAGAKPHALT
jgi:membrane protein